LVLIIITAASFYNVAFNHFINFDDNLYITENLQVQSGLSIQTIKWAFTAVVSSNWHPLTLLSHALDWSLFGSWAGGYHLVSLLLHIGAVLLLFLFLNKTTKQLWPSAIVAALFAVHPLRVESVAWAAERKDVLSMFFGMATLYAYAFYVEDKKIAKYLLCLFLFVLALMSKPMMVTLPFVMLLIDYWPLQRWGKKTSAPLVSTHLVTSQAKDKKKKKGQLTTSIAENPKSPTTQHNTKQIILNLLREKIPFFGLSVISSLITLWAQRKGGSIASLDKLPFSDRLANALVSYAAYLGKIFYPVDLSIFYPYQDLAGWQIAGAIFVLMVVTLVALLAIKRAPFLITGWLWYLGTLVPVIGLIQVGSQAMADRYTYLPSLGILIIVVWGGALLVPQKKLRKSLLIPLSAIIISIL
ncbi:MAG: glycosyltransferase family 39 protein, partial [Syntrophales bacterium]|nr:glycosyltransferase family 39 protein [Syntrophales bacterium]